MPKDSTKKFNKILFACLSTALGLLFLFSAFSKTMPVSPFIDSIYERFYITYQAASILARFIIGLEAGLGILLILGLYGKWRWVLYTVFGMLLAFSIFIVLIWINEGDAADCGCMGEWVKFSPLESLLKNIAMMALTLWLIFKDKKQEGTSRHYFAWIIPVLFICYPYIFVKGDLNIDAFYPSVTTDSIPQPPVDLRTGKHIVAFMSLTCSHCREAAAKFAQFKNEDENLPIIFIFSNHFKEEDAVQDFDKVTQSKKIPRYYIPKSIFREMAGKGVPSIYMLEGKKIEDKIDNYHSMKLVDLKNWYQE